MSLYQKIKESWKSKDNILWRERLIAWRKQQSIVKLDYPTRLDRARSLGYRAKQGYVLARVRLLKGGRQRPKFKGGRRSKHMRRLKILGMNYQWVAEQRANKKFHNCEVLNSYYIAKDAKHYWYEVILVDVNSPSIKADPKINWICERQHSKRVYRGLTSSARKSRGLRSGKGKGYEKNRPSLAAHRKRGKS